MKKVLCVFIVLCLLMAGCGTVPTATTTPTTTEPVATQKETVDFRVYLNQTHIALGKTTNIVPVIKLNEEMMETAVTFHVEDSAIANVSENGLVTATANGSTQITAKCTVNGKEYTAETVVYVEENMVINILQEELLPALGGDSVRINYSIYYNGEAINYDEVQWEVGDTKIAKVDKSGNVSAVALGETMLTVRYKTVEATIPVVVNTKCISTVAEFMAIRENLDMNYILTQDIDFLGVGMTFGFGDEDKDNRKAFTGTLDGNGYALKNVVVADAPAINASGTDKTFTIFAENRGTIKNIMFDVQWSSTKNVHTRIGIVHNNYGTFENVAFVGKTYANSHWDEGALSLVNRNFGTIRNCVAVLDMRELSLNKENWVNLTNRQGDKNARIENCVLVVLGSENITGTMTSVQNWGKGDKFLLGGLYERSNGKLINSSKYDGADAFFSAVVNMPGNKEWILDYEILYYGDEVLLRK